MTFLAVDIGNTNISFGLFKAGRLFKYWDIPGRGYSKGALSNHLGRLSLNAAFICSVAPRLNKKLSGDIFSLTHVKTRIIGKQVSVPLKNNYRRPAKLGQDRLVNAYAASKIYSCPAIIVSCGTALTIDALSGNNLFLGGFIIPGPQMSLDALHSSTALLPYVKLTKISGRIGTDTRRAMLNGVVYASAAAVSALIKRLKRDTGKDALVIGTGEGIALLSRFVKDIDRVDRQLTLKGIYSLFKDATGKG